MAGFTEFALISPLPARLEPDGRLRLQPRSGSFQVEVREQGGRRIDPSLAEVPEAWLRHPAYVMVPGDALELNLIQRGSPAEIQDALSLQRNLWLDFAGRGITFQDRIRGTLVSSSRLIASEIWPGEVRLDGVPALITALEDDPRALGWRCTADDWRPRSPGVTKGRFLLCQQTAGRTACRRPRLT